MKTTIVIIEDNILLRDAFVEVIDVSEDYEVVNVYSNCEKAIKAIVKDDPDIILMDIGLPGINGVEGTLRIKKILPETNIIIVTVYENSKMVFDALCAGATGYLTKNLEPNELLNALDECMKGGAPMSIKIAKMVVQSFKRNEDSELSKRETEILKLLSYGKTYASIGEELFISINTIKFHIKNIYGKLQVSCKEMAIQKANAEKLI
mgnify:CR=1 FL=1